MVRAPARQLLLALVGLLVGSWLALSASFHLVPLPQRLTTPGSTVVLWRDHTHAHVFLAPDDRWRIPVTAAEVDPAYVAALLALEDRRFHRHPGVDPLALIRAVGDNLVHRQRVGGSTLTMQLVRVLEPRPRTLRSKVVEVWRALQLERHLGKDEILGAYLTFAPFGRNVEGVAAASLAWFGHGPDALSPAEIATLLAVPQAPTTRHPSPANAERLQAGRDEVAAKLIRAGVLHSDPARPPADLLAEVGGTPVPTSMGRLPRHAPHLATWLRRQHPDRLRLHTTLDRGIQAAAEHHLQQGARPLQARGVANGAAVVVDHRTGEVLALVGNLPDGPGHAIPMFDVPRSPGSTLKPLVFARAIDRGLALPGQLVPDVPTVWADGYAPTNYDGRFDGLVRLDDALSRSLNVPFVHLLQQIGLEDFLGQLRLGGVESLQGAPGWYGLSAAVGGLELTALELAGLYATLARGGRHFPLRVLDPDAAPAEGIPLHSQGASWLTRQVLARRDRPDFPARRQYADAPTTIHWKTGTSFGHLDAWAAGSGPTRTALIWYGNADRTPSPALVGADAAGGPLFDLLQHVEGSTSLRASDPRPDDLIPVEVCAFSGYLPAGGCETRTAWALGHAVPTRTCPYTVQVEVDATTGEAVRPGCRGDRPTETRTWLRLPAQVRRYMAAQRTAPPPLALDCAGRGEGEPPVLVQPAAGEVILLHPSLPSHQQEVPFQADSAADTLHWFVDGAYLGALPSTERLWWTPSPGFHHLVVRDAHGQVARRTFEVRDRAL